MPPEMYQNTVTKATRKKGFTGLVILAYRTSQQSKGRNSMVSYTLYAQTRAKSHDCMHAILCSVPSLYLYSLIPNPGKGVAHNGLGLPISPQSRKHPTNVSTGQPDLDIIESLN